MANDVFSRVPFEVAREWIWSLECSDLCAYRLTCKKAERQTFELFAQRYFSTLETSLMGSDIKRLEGISSSVRLRKYIKLIFIRDDTEKYIDADFDNKDNWSFWPRNDGRNTSVSEPGFSTLNGILTKGRLCPETIQIRDLDIEFEHNSPAPVTELAQSVHDGTDLAIISFCIEYKPNHMYDATIELSKQHQGRNASFKMLQRADLCFSPNITPYWVNHVFFNSPSLEDLRLRAHHGWTYDKLYSTLSTNTFTAKLKRFHLALITIPAQTVLTILANSRDTLTDVSFISVVLCPGLMLRELLKKIGNDFPYLESFFIKGASEQIGDDRKVFRFQVLNKDELSEEYRIGLESWEVPAGGVNRWRYHGANTGAFLEYYASKPPYSRE